MRTTITIIFALLVMLCLAAPPATAQSDTWAIGCADFMTGEVRVVGAGQYCSYGETRQLIPSPSATASPVWKITIEGTAQEVPCTDAANARFCVYYNGTPEDETDDAVLDKETGLWWERSPDDTPRDWYSAISHCYKAKLANRKGLRLPTIEELASLVRYEGALASALPAGHPFINVKALYYSSSTSVNGANQAWGVDLSVFGLGSVVDYYKSDTAVDIRAWCVRGGQGHDAY